jgi:hypothetical protein
MRRMRIALFVGVLVMDPMSRNPENRSPFECKGATYRKEIFQPLWRAVSAMRQQPVVPHADSHVDGHNVQAGKTEKGLPAEHEERNDRQHVEGGHKAKCHPVHFILVGGAAQGGHVVARRSALFRFRPMLRGLGGRHKRQDWGGLDEFCLHNLMREIVPPINLKLTGAPDIRS